MKGKVLRTIRNIFDGLMIFLLFITTTVYALPSDGVIYDGSTSGSSATNVNDALNDLYSKLNQKQDEINNINNIGTAGANHILSGYTAYVKGKTITGSIASKGATTYTPGTSNQTIASGQYLSGAQTIKGDANLIAANIAKGKTIFGVAGSYTSDANATAADMASGKTAYVNGSKITGALKNLTTSTPIQHATNNGTRVVAGDAGYVSTNTDGVSRFQIRYNGEAGIILSNTLFGLEMSKVATTLGINASKVAKGQTIAGVAGSYTSDANAVAGNILSGKTAYVNGSKITGTIASKGATTYTPGTSNQTIASGNYLSGTQTIKGDTNLVAGNIAKGKSIFGVSGTYTSDATATAADIKSGKTAYVNGSKITGTAITVDGYTDIYVTVGHYGGASAGTVIPTLGRNLKVTSLGGTAAQNNQTTMFLLTNSQASTLFNNFTQANIRAGTKQDAVSAGGSVNIDTSGYAYLGITNGTSNLNGFMAVFKITYL